MKEKNILISAIIVFLTLIMTATSGFAQKEDGSKYPTKPIKLIIPVPPGSTDVLVRALSKEAEKYLGQPIVCENYPGGGLMVGTNMIKNAIPDGYTIGTMPTSVFAWHPFLNKVTYDPTKDFTLIMQFGDYDVMQVSTRSDAPFKTGKELIEYSRKNPGLKFSAAGNHTMHDTCQLIVAKRAGIDWKHVPYTGDMNALTALLGGHVSFMSGLGVQAPYIKSGQMISLASYTNKRSKYYPEVPTWRELGYAVGSDSRAGITGPSGIPKIIVEKLCGAFKKAVETDAFQEIAKKLLLNAIYAGPEEFAKFNDEQIKTTFEMFKELGVQIVK